MCSFFILVEYKRWFGIVSKFVFFRYITSSEYQHYLILTYHQKVFCGIHLRAISQVVFKNNICNMNSKSAPFNLLAYSQGSNELKHPDSVCMHHSELADKVILCETALRPLQNDYRSQCWLIFKRYCVAFICEQFWQQHSKLQFVIWIRKVHIWIYQNIS